jgi:serine/threonine-protein kinase
MLSQSVQTVYDFNDFSADTERRLLLCKGHPVGVSSRAFDILTVLIQNGGRTISKEELIRAVWNGRTVEENNLSVHISALRKALGEHPSEHRYIVTVPGEGYRFVASPRNQPASHLEQTQTAVSLAVLPFNVPHKPAWMAALGVGIADAVINRLASLPGLVVRPTSTVLRYPSLAQSAVSAGAELAVNFVLEGTLHHVRGRLRVQAQLVQVAAEAVLWTGKFDECVTNIVEVEDSISERVAQALMTTLTAADARRLRERQTESVEAHEAYLAGRYHWSQRSLPGLRKAIKCFERALEADSRYALAWNGIAQCYLVLGSYNHLSPSSTFPKAKSAAQEALRLDDRLADAHTCIAHVNMYFDWDWRSSEERFQRAAVLEPRSATVHHWYGVFLTYRGHFERAQRELQLAEKLDPVSLNIRMAHVQLAYFERQFAIAAARCKDVLRVAPNFAPANFWLGTICANEEAMLNEAIKHLRRAVSLLGGGYPVALGILGYALGRTGTRPAARRILQRLRKLSERQYVSAVVPAFVHAGLGQTEEALECLSTACRQRSDLLVHLGVEPMFDPLRSTASFQAILRTVGL